MYRNWYNINQKALSSSALIHNLLLYTYMGAGFRYNGLSGSKFSYGVFSAPFAAWSYVTAGALRSGIIESATTKNDARTNYFPRLTKEGCVQLQGWCSSWLDFGGEDLYWFPAYISKVNQWSQCNNYDVWAVKLKFLSFLSSAFFSQCHFTPPGGKEPSMSTEYEGWAHSRSGHLVKIQLSFPCHERIHKQ
jgi:hypothetical protein